MPNTPIFGWPYQALTDAPDGAALGEDLALAIEATMQDVISSIAEISEQVTQGTTTSTSFTATLTGGTACSVVFTAPLSGKVLIKNASLVSNSSTSSSLCSWRLGTGSTPGGGIEVLPASDNRSVRVQGTNVIRGSDEYLVTGLTPGATYNVQQMFRVIGNTGTFSSKVLIVVAA